MGYIQGPNRTWRVSAALKPWRRVRLNASGLLEYASAAHTDCVGVTTHETFAANEGCTVRLRSSEGTSLMVASEAIAITDTAYAAASGKIATSGSVLVGEPLEAASGNNSIIEVHPSPAAVLGNIARTALTQDNLQPYAIPLTEARVHDMVGTMIPITTAAADDLAIVNNTFATTAPTIEGGDVKATSSSRYARFLVPVPVEYVDGQSIEVRVNAGMKTTVSDTTCVLDVECVRQAAPSVDICADVAQDMNNLTAADLDFTLTVTNVVSGDMLDIRITVTYVDGATGTAVIPQINSVEMLMDIKG